MYPKDREKCSPLEKQNRIKVKLIYRSGSCSTMIDAFLTSISVSPKRSLVALFGIQNLYAYHLIDWTRLQVVKKVKWPAIGREMYSSYASILRILTRFILNRLIGGFDLHPKIDRVAFVSSQNTCVIRDLTTDEVLYWGKFHESDYCNRLPVSENYNFGSTNA